MGRIKRQENKRINTVQQVLCSTHRVPTQRAPIMANLEAEKVGRKDQSYVRQGRLSNTLPTKAEIGQNVASVGLNYHYVRIGHRGG